MQHGWHFFMNPGPTNIPDRILRAMDRGAIDFTAAQFRAISDECFAGLKRVFKTKETILAYARPHRAELPPEVTVDDLLWLRKSGVSERVIQYMAAIDVRAPDEGTEADVAYDSGEPMDYSAAGSYSDGYAGGYPYDSYAYGGYPDSYYGNYPETYYNDYYPFYPFYDAGYYPYPVAFFVGHNRFFGRFRGRGRGFEGHRGRSGRGGFGSPRSPRGGFDRALERSRGSVMGGPRGPGRSVSPRGGFGQAFGAPRGAVIRRGASGYPASPRGGFGRAPAAPRGPVVRGGGFGRPGFAGGGHPGGGFGRGSSAPSGGSRGAIGRPAGNGRR